VLTFAKSWPAAVVGVGPKFKSARSIKISLPAPLPPEGMDEAVAVAPAPPDAVAVVELAPVPEVSLPGVVVVAAVAPVECQHISSIVSCCSSITPDNRILILDTALEFERIQQKLPLKCKSIFFGQ